MSTAPTPRPLAASAGELLAGVQRRDPFEPAETRSGVHFERVWIGDEPFVVKYVHPDDDFTMRVSGDIGCVTVRAYAAGLLDAASHVIDHAIVGAAAGVGRNGWGGALLMRDVSRDLVPPGDEAFADAQHHAFVDHMAAFCAATWGWRDDLGLLPYPTRWSYFGDAAIDGERHLGWPERVPAIAAEGWERFMARAPGHVADGIRALRRDPIPLATELASTPSCFLHGDWKASNLGTAIDGRTVLIDWIYLGEGPACHELGWYLALNRQKLPRGQTKELVIEEFRVALERHGVSTGGWWPRQLALALLGTLVQFGWEKALGDDDELAWWCDRAAEGLAVL